MGITVPNGWGDKEKKSGIWELTENMNGKISEALVWNTEAILDDLKKNHVKVEKNVEMMWYEWKKIHINLPAVWNFKWFKFDCFVSNLPITRKDFEENPEFEKKSYSMDDISKLLYAMNEYMIELQGENDWDMKYEDKLKYWETIYREEIYGCKVWDFLKDIVWLNNGSWWHCVCWLKDAGDFPCIDIHTLTPLPWTTKARVQLALNGINCCFSNNNTDGSLGRLLLNSTD